MLCRSSLVTLAASLVLAPSALEAQDRDQLRSQAKAAAAELRAAGEPKDRCGIGAFVAGPAIVSRAYADTALAPGDRLLALAGDDVAGKDASQIVSILRRTAPSAVVPARIERNGKAADLTLSCANTRPSMGAMLEAIDKAAAGKFDECVAALSQRQDLGTYGAMMKAQCAATSKNAKQHPVAQFSHDAMKMLIEDAHWVPSTRAEVAGRLRALEGLITQQLGKAHYDGLISLAAKWPDGEAVLASSAPDWALFRRNAERTIVGRLIDPDSARIEWPFGFIYGTWKPLLAKRVEGYWTCGRINARNRMGGYTGATSFVVVLDRSGAVLFSDMGSGRDYDMVSTQCSNSLKSLPTAPVELAVGADRREAPLVSMADELKKLVDLKASGALTDAEFQAAKQKLLGGQGQQ